MNFGSTNWVKNQVILTLKLNWIPARSP